MNFTSIELTDKQFERVRRLIYKLSGISLKEGKEALVRARLMKRLRALDMSGFEEYLNFVESRKGFNELGLMVDVMTTNKTGFFREEEHFNYLGEMIMQGLKNRKMRFWTAACSSGEEPYSLGISLREEISDIDLMDIKILATDISTSMLEKARKAVYREEEIARLPPGLLHKYFTRARNISPNVYQVKDCVRKMVKVARLNLMDSWPMTGPFDVIFCRNVMIYFDRQTQQELINRFWKLLRTGGHLFVGHSEGLSAISHKFHYVRPAVYRK